MKYITCCISIPMSQVDDLNAMTDRARRITYRTARQHIGKNALALVFDNYDWGNGKYLTMKRDWHVGYYKSTFRGKPCIYVKHSAIEYIFC